MGSLGLPEIIFILLLALLIFGPRRLPEIGRTLGKGMAEFRKASNDLKRTINAELSLEEDEQSRHPRRLETPAALAQVLAPTQPSAPPAGTVAQMSQMTWENPIAPAPPETPEAVAADIADIAHAADTANVADTNATIADSTGVVAAPADAHPAPHAPATEPSPAAHPIEPS
jgi:sec-independent protein translocase protein TatA